MQRRQSTWSKLKVYHTFQLTLTALSHNSSLFSRKCLHLGSPFCKSSVSTRVIMSWMGLHKHAQCFQLAFFNHKDNGSFFILHCCSSSIHKYTCLALRLYIRLLAVCRQLSSLEHPLQAIDYTCFSLTTAPSFGLCLRSAVCSSPTFSCHANVHCLWSRHSMFFLSVLHQHLFSLSLSASVKPLYTCPTVKATFKFKRCSPFCLLSSSFTIATATPAATCGLVILCGTVPPCPPSNSCSVWGLTAVDVKLG